MAITLDRKTPGVFGIVFGAALSIALGGLIALAHLVAQPVEVLQTEPKERVAGANYFIQGASGGAGKTWERKHDQLSAGTGEVSLTEAEINAWSSDTFKPAEVKKAEKEGSVMIIAGTPNFRLVGKELQAGMVNTVNFFGSEAPLVLQARGGFVHFNNAWHFKPSEAYLGALPLHRVPALIPAVVSRFGVASVPADVAAALKRATDIQVSEGELIVRMP